MCFGSQKNASRPMISEMPSPAWAWQSFLVAAVAWLLIAPDSGWAAQLEQSGDEPPLPVVTLGSPVTAISEFLAYGPWEIDSRRNWHGAPVPLPLVDGRMAWAELEKPPFNATPRLTGDATVGVDFAPFAAAADNWKGDHIILLACRVLASKNTGAILDIVNGDNVYPYANGKYLGVVTNAIMPGGGHFHPLPVPLKKGENILLFKLVATRNAPRFKVNIIRDGSRDFDTAWRRGDGLLTRLVYTPAQPGQKPSVQWLSSLRKMTVQAGIQDASSGKIIQTLALKRGDMLKLDGNDLSEGAYVIYYENDSGRGEEQFVVGDPRRLKTQMENRLAQLRPDPKARINAETLLRRLEILCEPENYKLEDRKWQEKIAYTMGCLAGLLGALERGNPDPAKDAPGLHIRGFASSLDISTQHYRLYVPNIYQRGQKLPLLVILPTSISASQRPFIESPFIANHRDAMRISRVAEKYGFALLWPGYRNVPAGLPSENAHLDGVLKAVQADYDLDLQRIHLYGVCSGGIFAGNAAARWPGRFASIIYNRAIFKRAPEKTMDWTKTQLQWFQITDPTESILRNDTLSIFLTNTENVDEGHGEIALSHEFLDKAASLGKIVTADFSPPAIDDSHWDRVFQWAASCHLKSPDDKPSGFGAPDGFAGPVQNIFTTPVIIVEGTGGTSSDIRLIKTFSQSLQSAYADFFYGAKCKAIKDYEFDGTGFEGYSIILIGNISVNKVWQKMSGILPIEADNNYVRLGGYEWRGNYVFQAIYKIASDTSKYIMLLGASKTSHLMYCPTALLFEGTHDFALWRIDGPERALEVMDKMSALENRLTF
jgi:hypothetical protein